MIFFNHCVVDFYLVFLMAKVNIILKCKKIFNGTQVRVFQKTQSITDQVPLLVCAVTIISKTSPKKLDHFDEN